MLQCVTLHILFVLTITASLEVWKHEQNECGWKESAILWPDICVKTAITHTHTHTQGVGRSIRCGNLQISDLTVRHTECVCVCMGVSISPQLLDHTPSCQSNLIWTDNLMLWWLQSRVCLRLCLFYSWNLQIVMKRKHCNKPQQHQTNQWAWWLYLRHCHYFITLTFSRPS